MWEQERWQHAQSGNFRASIVIGNQNSVVADEVLILRRARLLRLKQDRCSMAEPRFDFSTLELFSEPVAAIESVGPHHRIVAANSAFRLMLGPASIGQLLGPVIGGADTVSCDEVTQALSSGRIHRLRVERGGYVFEFENRPRVANFSVIVGTDITMRESLAARVAFESAHDAITGLPNGTSLIMQIDTAIERSELLGAPGAVLICDLDQYRAISDGLGPTASAEFLRLIGERFERSLRFGDSVARLVGDEFAVLCSDVGDSYGAQAVARRMLESLVEPVVLETGEVFVSATVGIAVIETTGDSAARVLRDAHAALSQAKSKGRGSIEVFDVGIRERVVARIAVEKELHRALQRDELRVHYQPYVRLTTGDVIGFEALVRWQHPSRGLLSPTEFVAVAEETGLIIEIGAWLLAEAVRQIAEWGDLVPAGDPLEISVNLSARQIEDPNLVQMVERSLSCAGVDSSCLILEVTESTLMADTQHAARVLRELQLMGVRIAVDDFGTGHSSLGYLKQLPVDCLKIDRSFVAGLGVDPEDKTIIEAVVAMGHALGLSVVAEGIETVDQLRHLELLGCDIGQGFLIAKPNPASAIIELIGDRLAWRLAG